MGRAVTRSGAFLALTFDDDFGDGANDGFAVGACTADGQGHFGQAAHGATVIANEVRMGIFGMRRRSFELKSPDVIASIGTGCQAGIDKIDQIAVQSGPVEAALGKLGSNIGVAQGALGFDQQLQHGYPRRRAAQARLMQKVPKGFASPQGGSSGRCLCDHCRILSMREGSWKRQYRSQTSSSCHRTNLVYFTLLQTPNGFWSRNFAPAESRLGCH